MTDRLAPYAKWFDGFTRSHVPCDSDTAHLLDLKKKHVLRVLELASAIASGSGADTDELFLVELAALLHDAGRFPQLARHKSHDDAVSGNHGRLGARVVLEGRLLDKLGVRERKAVLTAVNYHNRTTAPNHLPRLSAFVLGVVRDADKLDVLRHIVGQLRPGDHLYRIISDKVVWHETAYSHAALEQLEERGLVDLEAVVYVNDYKLFLCGWINDLNFPATFGLLKEFGDYDRLLDSLPRNGPLAELKAALRLRLAAC